MSSDIEQAVKASAICNEQIKSLRHWAIQCNSLSAIVALEEVARTATQALHDLWSEYPIFNPFDQAPKARLAARARLKRAARREAMTYWIGTDREFPTLHSWMRPDVKGVMEARQNEILQGMRFGPFNGTGRKRNQMRMLVHEIVLPFYRGIQYGTARPDGIDGEIWDLPPLTSETVAPWVNVTVGWLWKKNPSAMNEKGSPLYRLANPEKELKREQRKRGKPSKWEENMLNSPLRDGRDESVAATNIEFRRGQREERIAAMTVIERHITEGLKAALTAYLKRHLSGLKTSP